MKIKWPFKNGFAVLISSLIIFSVLYAAKLAEIVYTWTETSVLDFDDNILTDLMITHSADGEVCLPFPLVKTEDDFRDGMVKRFSSADSNGNFIYAWVEAENIYVQKYDAQGAAITKKLKVNDAGILAYQGEFCRTALFESGNYIVVWTSKVANNSYSQMHGQIFCDDSIKVGQNFKINEYDNSSNRIPTAFANDADQAFWILYPSSANDSSRIRVQRWKRDGQQYGGAFNLNSKPSQRYELSLSVSKGRGNHFLVAWQGSNKNSSDYADIYMRLYDSDGKPLTGSLKINDDVGYFNQYQPDVSCDDYGNFLVVWTDWRNNKQESAPYAYDIYGQYVNPDGKKLRGNFQINSLNHPRSESGDVSFKNGQYHISFFDYASGGIFKNIWDIRLIKSGEMISSIFDAGPGGAKFKKLFWKSSLPENTSIKVRLRSSGDRTKIEEALWHGPSDSVFYYTNSSGTLPNPIHNGDRYIQYAAGLETLAEGFSPTLQSISLSYSPTDTIAPLPPENLIAEPGYSQVCLSWQSLENDILQYRLYRWDKDILQKKSWIIEATEYTDTTVISNTLYHYAVCAIDSSHNQSIFSNEVTVTPYGISLYASATGSTFGNGTYQFPYSSINQALAAAQYGDRVIVLPGTYYESIDLKEGVAVLGSGPSCTQLIGNSGEYTVKGADHASLKGFKISRAGIPAVTIFCENTSPEIADNIIQCTQGIYDPAIRCISGGSPVFSGNYIDGYNTAFMFHDKVKPLIRNNIINAKECGIQGVYYCAPQIINNTIVTLEYAGIELIHYCQGVIENNIFLGLSSSKGMGIYLANSTTTVRFNDAFNHYVEYSPSTIDETNLELNPLFVNRAAQNYQLQDGSPCRDSGNPSSSFNDVDGSRNDMGAFGGPYPMDAKLTSQLTRSIALDCISAFPGDTVIAMLRIDEAIGLAAAALNIEFNPGILTFLKAGLTQTTAAFSLQINQPESGFIKLNLSSDNPVESGENSLLALTFIVSPELIAGDASALAISEAELTDGQGNDILLYGISDGVFMVNQGSPDGRYIFVDGKADESGDGTYRAPFDSIQVAMQHAAAGDTIVVSSGQYFGTIEIKEGVYLRGAGALVTFINLSREEPGILFNDIREAEISGFTIRGPLNEPSMEPLIRCNSSSPFIQRNRFELYPFGSLGIEVSENSSPQIKNNALVNVSISIRNSAPLIQENNITGGDIAAIYCAEGSSPSISRNYIHGNLNTSELVLVNESSLLLTNNIVEGDACAAHLINLNKGVNVTVCNNIILSQEQFATSILSRDVSNLSITNNTICSEGSGIDESGSGGVIFNNIIMDNNVKGLHHSESTRADYNDLWQNELSYSECDSGLNDLFMDPLFQNINAYNFRLQSNSPCIDAGNPEMQYNDLDGTRNDIGAFGGPYADPTWLPENNTAFLMKSLSATFEQPVNITIEGQSLKNTAGLDLTLSYDPAVLEFRNASTTNITRSFSLQEFQVGEQMVRISLKANNGINLDRGGLLNLNFIVKAKKEISSKISFESLKHTDETGSENYIQNLEDGVIHIVTSGLEDAQNSPDKYELFQNYPNPFNSATTIRYQIPQGQVRLEIYDLTGRLIFEYDNTIKNPGVFSFVWDGRNRNGQDVASGLYLYRIKSGSFSSAKKMLLIR